MYLNWKFGTLDLVRVVVRLLRLGALRRVDRLRRVRPAVARRLRRRRRLRAAAAALGVVLPEPPPFSDQGGDQAADRDDARRRPSRRRPACCSGRRPPERRGGGCGREVVRRRGRRALLGVRPERRLVAALLRVAVGRGRRRAPESPYGFGGGVGWYGVCTGPVRRRGRLVDRREHRGADARAALRLRARHDAGRGGLAGRAATRRHSSRMASALGKRSFGFFFSARATSASTAGRQRAVDRGGRHRLLLHVRVRDRQRRVRVERQPPGDQLEEHDADRVQVGPGVHPAAERLFGGEVLRGAHDHAGLRHRRHAGLHGAGDAEVHHLDDAALGHHHVARLDVPVDQAHLVADLQRRQHVRGDLQRLVGGHRAVLPDVRVEHRAERAALDVLHDDVRRRRAVESPSSPVSKTETMLVCVSFATACASRRKRSRKACSRPSSVCRVLIGDLPVEHGVVGEVHRGHAALAEQIAQLVAAAGHRPPRVPALCAVLAHVLRPPVGALPGAD